MSIIRYVDKFNISGIVLVSKKEWEKKSGYYDEHVLEEIACLKGGKPKKLHIKTVSQSFHNNYYNDIENEEDLTFDEYQHLCTQFGILDTDEKLREWRESEQRIKELKDQRLNLEAQFLDITPKCPSCKIPMVLRHKKKDRNKHFWGCINFNACKRIKGLTKEQLAILEKLKR